MSKTCFAALGILSIIPVIFFPSPIEAQETLSPFTKWGSYGVNNSQFKLPSAIAADASGNVYVADTANNRIQKFSSDGTFIAKWGTFGIGSGQFKLPSAIAADNLGNVYVADTANNRIQEFIEASSYVPEYPHHTNIMLLIFAISGSLIMISKLQYASRTKVKANEDARSKRENGACNSGFLLVEEGYECK